MNAEAPKRRGIFQEVADEWAAEKHENGDEVYKVKADIYIKQLRYVRFPVEMENKKQRDTLRSRLDDVLRDGEINAITKRSLLMDLAADAEALARSELRPAGELYYSESGRLFYTILHSIYSSTRRAESEI